MKKWLVLTLSGVLIAADQLIKIWALNVLAPVESITVIPGLFSFTYVENRGAAFGIMQNKTDFLSIVSGAVLALLLFALITNRFKTGFLVWTVGVGVAGGIGNLIDRVSRGFVVDYLDFSALLGFPVFNLADCCVVCASVLIFIYVLRTERKNTDKTPESGKKEA